MTDNKIVALPGVTPQVTANIVDPDVVRGLEVLLEKAKAGEIKWFGCVWVDAVNIAHSIYEPYDSDGPQGALLTAALGAVSYLDKRLGDSILDGAIDVSTVLDRED